MKAQFTVTIEGKWWHNGKPATAAIVERELREAAKERFAFLADRVTVRKVNQPENLGAANTNKGGEAK